MIWRAIPAVAVFAVIFGITLAFFGRSAAGIQRPPEQKAAILQLPSADGFESEKPPDDGNYLKNARTRGDHTWIPIGQTWGQGKGDLSDTILFILAEFEKTHPELAVTSWNVEKRSSADWSFVLGLWVNHRVRQKYDLVR